MRRLQRVCRHYGSDPTFICSSATIANPRELAERLVGAPFELVEQSGAPRGEKFFLFVNPPVVNAQLGIRRSYLAETRRVAIEFLKRGLQLIVFAQSRLSTEILTTYLKDAFAGPPGAADVIRGYRGGYLPLRRREIERGLRSGEVRCVVSTNALELGIDIGALDVAVMAGYPGTIAATWQRAGRAGRRVGPIGGRARRLERADRSVRRAQSRVLLRRVARARARQSGQPAHPARPREVRRVRAAVPRRRRVRRDQRAGDPVRARAKKASSISWTGSGSGRRSRIRPMPSACGRSRRTTSSSSTRRNGERVIGETDFTSGPSTLHEKAIYIVEGQLFQVERFDFDGRKAFVRAVECDYYTDAITYTKVTILDTFAGRQATSRPEAAASLASRRSRCGRSRAIAGIARP